MNLNRKILSSFFPILFYEDIVAEQSHANQLVRRKASSLSLHWEGTQEISNTHSLCSIWNHAGYGKVINVLLEQLPYCLFIKWAPTPDRQGSMENYIYSPFPFQNLDFPPSRQPGTPYSPFLLIIPRFFHYFTFYFRSPFILPNLFLYLSFHHPSFHQLK